MILQKKGDKVTDKIIYLKRNKMEQKISNYKADKRSTT